MHLFNYDQVIIILYVIYVYNILHSITTYAFTSIHEKYTKIHTRKNKKIIDTRKYIYDYNSS